MIKFIRISVIVLLLENSFASSKSLDHNAISVLDEHSGLSYNFTSTIDNSTTTQSNSSQLKTAESRLFPIGAPNLLPSPSSGLISPFDVASFSKQLLPLINFHVKEKVKDFAKSLGDSADFIEDALRDGWRESPLNPHNFKNILNPPEPIFKPQHATAFRGNSLRKPGSPNFYHREKAPNGSPTQTKDGLMHEFGIDGYKHFEKSILRELEKQEEMKVEATIHTLFEQGDKVQVIKGKPYRDFSPFGWKAMTAPTKNYEDPNDIHSQIISPLHTSFYDAHPSALTEIDASSHVANSFHDFDNFNDNSIHLPARYPLVHEEVEELETKVKPVVRHAKHAKVSPIKLRASTMSTSTSSPATTKTSRLSSRYRKRHNNGELRVVGQTENVTKIADSGASASHHSPRAVVRPIKLRNHFQSYTSQSRPARFKPAILLRPEESRILTSTENPWHSPIYKSSSTSTTTKTKTTTKSPKKFVDQIKSNGYRGSIKFGHTKPPSS